MSTTVRSNIYQAEPHLQSNSNSSWPVYILRTLVERRRPQELLDYLHNKYIQDAYGAIAERGALRGALWGRI